MTKEGISTRRAIQKSLTHISLNEKYLSFPGEKSSKNRPTAENWQDGKSKRTRQKNTRGDRKWDSNNIPEIPGIGVRETSDILGLTSG